MKNPKSITGKYLSGKISIPLPEKRREPKGYLKVVGAKENNLKNINVKSYFSRKWLYRFDKVFLLTRSEHAASQNNCCNAFQEICFLHFVK